MRSWSNQQLTTQLVWLNEVTWCGVRFHWWFDWQGHLPFPGLRVPLDGCVYDVVPSVNQNVGGEYFKLRVGLSVQIGKGLYPWVTSVNLAWIQHSELDNQAVKWRYTDKNDPNYSNAKGSVQTCSKILSCVCKVKRSVGKCGKSLSTTKTAGKYVLWTLDYFYRRWRRLGLEI